MNPVSAWLQAPRQPPPSAAVPPASASQAAPLSQGRLRPPPAAQLRQPPPLQPQQPQQQPQALPSHLSRGAAPPRPAGRLADAIPSRAAPSGTASPTALQGQSAPSVPEQGKLPTAGPSAGTQASGADVAAAAAPASAGIPFRQQPGPVRRGSSAELWQDLLPTDDVQGAGELADSFNLNWCQMWPVPVSTTRVGRLLPLWTRCINKLTEA